MKTKIAMLAALAGLMLGPIGAAAATTGQGPVVPLEGQTFDTTLVSVDRITGGAYEGVLRLNISSDGIVQGTFRDAGTPNQRSVIGGLTGDQIWFDIGNGTDATHITGTYRDGIIEGFTFRGQTYKFEAKPVTT
jgi:hypothetical protein